MAKFIPAAIVMDHDAFMRRCHRQQKDKDWEFAVASHTRWQEIVKKYPNHQASEYAKQRMADLEAQFPQLKKEL